MCSSREVGVYDLRGFIEYAHSSSASIIISKNLLSPSKPRAQVGVHRTGISMAVSTMQDPVNPDNCSTCVHHNVSGAERCANSNGCCNRRLPTTVKVWLQSRLVYLGLKHTHDSNCLTPPNNDGHLSKQRNFRVGRKRWASSG